MSKTVLANVDGFTPVIDGLAKELSVITAIVFGVVWRYCQMKDGVCTASYSTISEKAGIGRSTVCKHLKKLVAAGYLSKTKDPNPKSTTLTYKDTGKAGMNISIGCSPREQGVPDVNAGCSPRELKIVSTKIQNQSDKTPSEPKINEQALLVGALCKVLSWDVDLCAPRVARLAVKLRQKGATPDMVIEMYSPGGWFWRSSGHWVAEQHKNLNQAAITETWGAWNNQTTVKRMPTAQELKAEFERKVGK